MLVVEHLAVPQRVVLLVENEIRTVVVRNPIGLVLARMAVYQIKEYKYSHLVSLLHQAFEVFGLPIAR